jgi:hypothetical protein
LWPNLRYYPSICLERLGKQKKSDDESLCGGQGSKSVLSKHEGVLSTRSRPWVSSMVNDISRDIVYIVAYLLHARTVEPQKQSFLSNTHMQQWNNEVMQPDSRQRLGKHSSAQAQ